MSTEILRVERALLCVLAPLTGTRATGQVLVHATGGDVQLPGGSYAAPIIQGQPSASGAQTAGGLNWNLMIKTATAAGTPLPPFAPKPTTVTSAGTLVPCFSMIGGGNQNLLAGTQVRWHPPIPGVEAVSTISGNMTGGLPNTGIEAVASLSSIDGWSPQNAGAKLRAAGAGQFPAVLVSWESANPQGGQKAGIGRTLYNHTWRVYVIIPRYEGDHLRRDDAKVIQAALSELLDDSAAVDGEHFASLHVFAGNWGRLTMGRDFYAYWSDFVLPHAVGRRDARTWNVWAKTRVQMATNPDPTIQPPDAPIITVDMTVPNPQYPYWAISTEYAFGVTVIAGSGVYRCATAGLSAATGVGPVGGSDGIIDGTAIWNFVSEA